MPLLDHIINYKANPNDPDAIFGLLTDGIKEAYEKVAADHSPNLGETNELLRHIYTHCMIINCIETSETYKELKPKLVDLMKALYRTKQNIDIANGKYVASILERIRDEEQSKQAMETSVITGSAIIAPYVGTLKKPFQVYTSSMEEAANDVKNQRMANCLVDSHKREVLKKNALTKMVEIILDRIAIDHIIIGIDALLNTSTDPSYIFNIIRNFDHMAENDPPLGCYSACIFLYRNANNPDFNFDLCNKLLDAMHDVLGRPLRDVIDTYTEALAPVSESDLLDDLDHYDTIAKYMKNPEMAKMADAKKDPLDEFDLTPLMNYIFTSRRFRANHYTNSAFANLSYIGGYAFYDDYLIIEPSTAEGVDLNYLYIPVIDDANGSQVVVLKYWRNGKIEVLTQYQYEKEIKGLNTD